MLGITFLLYCLKNSNALVWMDDNKSCGEDHKFGGAGENRDKDEVYLVKAIQKKNQCETS